MASPPPGGSTLRTRSILIVAALAASLLPASPAQAAPSLAAYRGLGAWIDIYDPTAWDQPGRKVRRLAARGVRTLYLQSNNYHQPGDIRFPAATGRFVDAAHRHGMKIVAWYLPGLKDLHRDQRRAMAAIRFRSPEGRRFHSFALDIQATIVKDIDARNRRLLRLSDFLRARVGSSYPMGAIIPSPRGMQLAPGYWPRFPYRALAERYDVFVPMTYYSWRASGAAEVTDYMRRSIRILRSRTEDPGVPIHAIGGLADGSSRSETRAYVRSVREHGLLGGSLYDDSLFGAEDWEELARVRPNPPRQSPPMPLRFGEHTDGYGRITGGDRTHPDEVVYRHGPLSSDQVLSFEGFDIGAAEVEVQVNWTRLVVPLAAGPPEDWTPARQTILIPASALRPDAKNVISFVPKARHPWTTWGVRDVTLTPA